MADGDQDQPSRQDGPRRGKRPDPFNPNGPLSFDEYLQRWAFHFRVQKITDADEKRDYFVDSQDDKTFSIISKICTPTSPEETSFETITTRLSQYFMRNEPQKIVYQDQFNQRIQGPQEPAAEYIAELSSLATKCGLKAREELLVPKIISGLKNMKLKEEFLAEESEKLTWDYVTAKIYAHERAAVSAQSLSNPPAVHQVGESARKWGKKGQVQKQQRGQGSGLEDQKKPLCSGCGRRHERSECTFKDVECFACKKRGHIAREEEESDEGQEEAVTNYLLQIEARPNAKQKKIELRIPLAGRELTMEVDTGATYSLIGWPTFVEYFPDVNCLQPSEVKMKAWGQNGDIRAAGKVVVQLQPKGKPPVMLDLLVMEKEGPALIGRNWFKPLGISVDVPELIFAQTRPRVSKTVEVPQVFHMTQLPPEFSEFADVFEPGLGRYKGAPVHIPLKPEAKPRQLPARNVPFGLREKAGKALDELERKKVIEKVMFSEWATPVVYVEKGDSVRLCADFSATVNPACASADFPLPSMDQLISGVKPGSHFAKIDLADAYLQFEVDEESSKLLTISTHKALEFLGYSFTPEGVRPTPGKLKALEEMRVPENVEELRAWLGLLKKGVPFTWSDKCQEAWNCLKSILMKRFALAYFDPAKPLRLACDGSKKGVGAVLSQLDETGNEIEVEALSIVWAVKKLKKYLWGLQFELVTDHKPLLGIFAKGKPMAEDLPSKMKRLSLPCTEEEDEEEESRIAFLQIIENKDQLSLQTFQDETKWDEKLQLVYNCILQERAVVPSRLRARVLELLHSNHFGQTRMKALARQFFWWPQMDEDITRMSACCQPCALFNRAPAKAPIIPWSVPHRPWGRVHLDFFEVSRGKTFIVAADGLSGWIDAEATKNMDTETAIKFCRKLFRVQGLCDILVCDNGPAFRAQEFKNFCERQGIELIFSPPYSPQTNGLAERAVQTVKTFLKKVPEIEWPARLDSFLLGHNSTPLAATGVAPAEFNLGRRPQTVIDRLRPEMAIIQRQTNRDKRAVASVEKLPKVPVPEQVATCRSYRDPKVRWETAQVVRALGPRRVLLQTNHGPVERHADQIRLQPIRQLPDAVEEDEEMPQVNPEATQVQLALPEPMLEEETPEPGPSTKPITPVREERRRPSREVRLPSRFRDFVLK
ncbi:Hypothetical predicted protein [Cloeon dipterum]|uniref:RNA-directed DNA polymerase n=1 Tax=Cloeon dipterum TaxID=197152 RepID=A0A8S1D6R9_9INSE|nr:Hypothetical predicted protein [Cloeon dipterum]